VALIVDDATKSMAKADDKTRPVRMKILAEAIKVQALLASKLRLATQSRVDPRALSRKRLKSRSVVL
jgi:hypothetical protein